MNDTGFRIEIADWATHGKQLYSVRRQVFIEEQGVPKALEQDALDKECQHAIAWDDEDRPIATGRLLPDGHIGRLAVLRSWRGRGLGKALMRALTQLAQRQGIAVVELNAQTHALGFYENLGFKAKGEEFMEAGIPHRHMRLILKCRA